MPFAYYGAKHNLARKYPKPQHDVIVEPFAGSAAYSVKWATDSTHVILYDADPAVVELWHRLQSMTTSDLNALDRHAAHDAITCDPLVAASGGGTSLAATLAGRSRVITPRMRKDWPALRKRIERALPRVRRWEINHGAYHEAPTMNATWFIDPPYSVHELGYSSVNDASGNGYRHGASGIDYRHLADWCTSRHGQVIVCEQAPANWLPFTAFHEQLNAQNDARTEVVWTNDGWYAPIQTTLFQ